MRIYYAHFMGIYDTPQEARDLELLRKLFPGDVIVNPNNPRVASDMEAFRGIDTTGMGLIDYFRSLVQTCNVLAFRALPGGKISSGVVIEIEEARRRGLLVIELPGSIEQRKLNYAQTVEVLREWGQR